MSLRVIDITAAFRDLLQITMLRTYKTLLSDLDRRPTGIAITLRAA